MRWGEYWNGATSVVAALDFRSVSDLISRYFCCVNCVTVLACCLSPQRDLCLQDCSFCSTLYPLINVYDTWYTSKFLSVFFCVSSSFLMKFAVSKLDFVSFFEQGKRPPWWTPCKPKRYVEMNQITRCSN